MVDSEAVESACAMKRLLFFVTTAGSIMLGSILLGAPVVPLKQQLVQVPQFSSVSYTREFKGGEIAKVIASGSGASYMGLYVYDIYGNCIAWDDEGTPATCDDLEVEWEPREKGIYTVEVRNCGPRVNQCKVIFR
jgi:hypothetical protein